MLQFDNFIIILKLVLGIHDTKVATFLQIVATN